jgi:Holliday junction DNA helicase RuvA
LRERSQAMISPLNAERIAGMPADAIGEASIALQQLGYKQAEISRMVKDAKPGDSAEDIIRAALKSALRS